MIEGKVVSDTGAKLRCIIDPLSVSFEEQNLALGCPDTSQAT